jgi:hypothetical protein
MFDLNTWRTKIKKFETLRAQLCLAKDTRSGTISCYYNGIISDFFWWIPVWFDYGNNNKILGLIWNLIHKNDGFDSAFDYEARAYLNSLITRPARVLAWYGISSTYKGIRFGVDWSCLHREAFLPLLCIFPPSRINWLSVLKPFQEVFFNIKKKKFEKGESNLLSCIYKLISRTFLTCEKHKEK